MYKGLEQKDDKKYVNILGSDGSLRITVSEGTEGAKRREYETSDGKTGVKYEHVFKSISGMVTDLSFYDGDYGKNILMDFDNEGEILTLTVNTASNFGEDLMKKLPNIDFSQRVLIIPYAFEDEKGKTRKGLTINNQGDKVQNFFYDAIEKKNINNYPDPKPNKGDKPYSKDDWKIYFIETRKFLTEYTEENILPKFADKEKLVESQQEPVVPF